MFYFVLLVVLVFIGYGNGIEDSVWNVWIGNMYNVNEFFGFFYGVYGLGVIIGFLIVIVMVIKGGLEWYMFYYVMIGLDGVGFVFLMVVFWRVMVKLYRV